MICPSVPALLRPLRRSVVLRNLRGRRTRQGLLNCLASCCAEIVQAALIYDGKRQAVGGALARERFH